MPRSSSSSPKTEFITLRSNIFYQKILKEKFGSLLNQGTHVVDALIHHALLSSAQGIHIDLHTTALVRYRINGILREAMQLPAHIGAQLVEQLKVLAKLLPTSSTVQEGRFKFDKDGEGHMVHVSALPTAQGERLVLRVARESAGVSGFALTSLGLHGMALEQVHTFLRAKSGLVVVAGPRGGGKTTTLYTLLDQLNHAELSISTVEEKVEHRFVHIAQIQTKPELGLTTLAGLRAILRQDPDVVMVGEIKDADTLALAMHAASMGVLVLVGLEVKAASAGDVVEKIREMGASPSMLATVLRGVIVVDTVKKLCTHDREEYLLSRAEGAPLEPYANFGRVLGALKEEKIVEEEKQWKEILFARAISCSQCQEGYKGVVGLQEVLSPSAMTKALIMSGEGGGTIEAQAQEEGVLNLSEDALYKAALGLTSIEEVFRLVRGE
jgi:type IV pilus assembly protein PilB